MAEIHPVEVDFEVYQLIELERISFDEPRGDALRRLLKLPVIGKHVSRSASLREAGKAWQQNGAYLPHGTELRMQYNGQEQTGEISNGEWVVEGQRCKSPSHAAGAVAKTKKGGRANLNGWNYWDIRRPGETAWTQISELHKK